MASINTQRLRKTNSGAAIKVACQAASTANLTLEGEQTVDGIALLEANEDRVLCKDQTDATENGIYIVSTGAWTRAPDFNGSFDVAEGTLIPVSRGTLNGATTWRVTNTGTITVGTTSLTTELEPSAVAPSLQSAVATTSGTSVTQTGIPSWVTRITVAWHEVSWNGSGTGTIRIGDSGGIETSGYAGRYLRHAGDTPNNGALSSGFTMCDIDSAADLTTGVAYLDLVDASTNTWVCVVNAYVVQNSVTFVCNGRKSLTGTLDRVEFTSTIPDTFDAGTVSFKWE